MPNLRRWNRQDFIPTFDRSYRNATELIFQLYDVSNWEELEARGPDDELFRAYMDLELMNWDTVVRMSLKEQAGEEENATNRRAFIRRAAEKRGLTEAAVRHYVYD